MLLPLLVHPAARVDHGEVRREALQLLGRLGPDEHVGDEVLIKVAKSLRITVRRSDCISRWGGEEFLILLPSCGLEDAVQMAEKLRLSISHIQLPDGHSVSVSVGVAGWLVGETSMEFIKRADAAMYQAKANGRDRVSWTSV